jgi:hypothetical protein
MDLQKRISPKKRFNSHLKQKFGGTGRAQIGESGEDAVIAVGAAFRLTAG